MKYINVKISTILIAAVIGFILFSLGKTALQFRRSIKEMSYKKGVSNEYKDLFSLDMQLIDGKFSYNNKHRSPVSVFFYKTDVIYVLKYPITSSFSLNSVVVSTAKISPSSGYVYNVIKQSNSVLKYKNDTPVFADSLGIFISENTSLISGDSLNKFIYTEAENFSIVEKYSDICDLSIRINGTKQFLTAGLLRRNNWLFVVVLVSKQNDKDLLKKLLVK